MLGVESTAAQWAEWLVSGERVEEREWGNLPQAVRKRDEMSRFAWAPQRRRNCPVAMLRSRDEPHEWSKEETMGKISPPPLAVALRVSE